LDDLFHSINDFSYVSPEELSFTFTLNGGKVSKVPFAELPTFFHRNTLCAEIILFVFMYDPSILSSLIFCKINGKLTTLFLRYETFSAVNF